MEIEGEMSEAEGYLKAMDVEYRTMSSSDKKGAQQKISEYRNEYKDILEKFNSTKANAESAALKNSSSQRTKLVTANTKLDSSTAMLEQTRQVLAQTETVGSKVIIDLESQKKTLKEAKGNVDETRYVTREARIILKNMGNRALYHKACIICFIFILAGVIAIIIYYAFIKKSSGN